MSGRVVSVEVIGILRAWAAELFSAWPDATDREMGFAIGTAFALAARKGLAFDRALTVAKATTLAAVETPRVRNMIRAFITLGGVGLRNFC